MEQGEAGRKQKCGLRFAILFVVHETEFGFQDIGQGQDKAENLSGTTQACNVPYQKITTTAASSAHVVQNSGVKVCE